MLQNLFLNNRITSLGFLGSHSYKKHTTKCAKMRLNSNKLAMGVQARITNPQNMQTMFSTWRLLQSSNSGTVDDFDNSDRLARFGTNLAAARR